ncbi:tetratricopeptide repeat protein [Bradyrhizobium vignae]|uniref:Uncharacterized protein n=1 Tax=Bradyrhizobium vignae TaxID=1549949 RepID=A0A2U3PVB6_9BRAD|nr:tetratricopeptide repeat protein [Bradyrhizobium vignae]SPP93095.1 protein of unknown function [Bradyrhizobium vignae]
MRGNKEQALIDYNKSVALAPKDGRMWRSRASFYIDEQQYDKARQDLEKAASLGEKDACMAFTRGRLDFATGDYRAALSQFDDAVGSPQARNAYYYRSRTYAALKDISSALSDADMFVQNQPDEIAAYSWRGRLYASSKDYASASKDFAVVIKMGNRSAYMLNELAWSLFKTGRNSEALTYAEEAYKLASSDANVIDTRAHVYEALGRKQEAISDFRKAVALKPELETSRLGLRRLGAE